MHSCVDALFICSIEDKFKNVYSTKINENMFICIYVFVFCICISSGIDCVIRYCGDDSICGHVKIERYVYLAELQKRHLITQHRIHYAIEFCFPDFCDKIQING